MPRFYRLLPLTGVLIALLLALPLCGCKPAAGTRQNGASGTNAKQASQTGTGTPAEQEGNGAMPAPQGDVKQVLLIYTGDTLSALEAQTQSKPPLGGLSGLASAVTQYQREIIEFTAKRVENEGGDPSTVRADFAAGMLGPHPRLLLDYGGWERPNDFAGVGFVQLYFNYFHDFGYTAIGGMRYQELKPELWASYNALKNAPELLASAGAPQPGTTPEHMLRTQKVVIRECHGKRWGIACLPLPGPSDLDAAGRLNPGVVEKLLADAKAALAGSGCDFSILLAAGHPAPTYQLLQDDPDIDIVIGVPHEISAAAGDNDLPAGRPLLLPELDKAGRQLGICHLIYMGGASEPTRYNLLLRDVTENKEKTAPYFKQVYAAKAAHQKLVDARSLYKKQHPGAAGGS